MTTLTYIRERQKRRPVIIEGIKQGLKHSEIATQLGVKRRMIKRDLKIMLFNGDSELKQTLERAEAEKIAKRQPVARLRDERFLSMTGMSLKEKSFSNMMSFYEPELMKILKSKNECTAIRDLPKSVRRTLKRNGIIVQRWKTPEITVLARTYLTRMPSVDS